MRMRTDRELCGSGVVESGFCVSIDGPGVVVVGVDVVSEETGHYSFYIGKRVECIWKDFGSTRFKCHHWFGIFN